jgi:parallel beta-helix repeat protein
MLILCLVWLGCLPTLIASMLAANLPVVTVQSDDTQVAQSCRIEIPPGLILNDANKNGVIQVVASDIIIEFAPGAVLRGAASHAAPDTYEGYGIHIARQYDVTIRGGRISGFRAAVWASDAPGLTLESIDASDNRRMHLRSTPEKEAAEDWLYPHNNDERSWLDEYGSALYVERSDRLTVRDCKVWHSQNALCLDRVNDARICDNDFSFNSGWGIALWRSCRNVITRNACDFCIRGYSHGVYNRGQDSAGLLFFEQCSDNIVAENSATHCGDGFFGFAGKEALAKSARPASAPASAPTSAPGNSASQPAALGCDRNLLINNDFSYAAAHGIEMTFSFDNRFIGNRLIGNAICGIWAGYCQRTLIADNEIAENGDPGYGLERGGIDIDSGRLNQIVGNKFRQNACGVHLWWTSPPPDLIAWARRNLLDCEGNLIAGNVFDADELTFHFRGRGKVTLAANELLNTKREVEAADQIRIVREEKAPSEPYQPPTYPAFGRKHPVGARAALSGRENIIMTEWGPSDHVSPPVRP